MNESLPGETARHVTLSVWPVKYRTYPSLWRSSNRKESVLVSRAPSIDRVLVRTVHLGTGVEDLARVMSESSQMHTILLAGHGFRELALFNIEDLDSLVVASRDQVFALIVEV